MLLKNSDLNPFNIPTSPRAVHLVIEDNVRLEREKEALQAAYKTLRRAFPYKCGQKVYTVIDGRIFRHIIREIRFTCKDVYIDGVSYKNVYTCLKRAQAAQKRSETE